MKLRRSRLLEFAVVGATAVVVVLLVLIGIGYLVLPASTVAPVTVSGTRYSILEGTNASGHFWFGPNNLSYPGLNGYPLSVAPGSSFGVPIVLWNHDFVNHTVYSVFVDSPFVYHGSHPAVPIVVPAGEDSANFVFTISAPSDPGASLVLSITINTLNPPP